MFSSLINRGTSRVNENTEAPPTPNTSEGKGHHGKKAKGHNFTKSVTRQHFGLVLEKLHANMQFKYKFSATGRVGYAV